MNGFIFSELILLLAPETTKESLINYTLLDIDVTIIAILEQPT